MSKKSIIVLSVILILILAVAIKEVRFRKTVAYKIAMDIIDSTGGTATITKVDKVYDTLKIFITGKQVWVVISSEKDDENYEYYERQYAGVLGAKMNEDGAIKYYVKSKPCFIFVFKEPSPNYVFNILHSKYPAAERMDIWGAKK